MKTIHIASLTLLITSFGALAADAKPKRATPRRTAVKAEGTIAVKDADVKFNFGEEYTLGDHKMKEVVVADTDKVDARPISDSQVAQVVRDRVEDLEYCWLRVPAAKRTASSATLHLAIEAAGTVAGASVEGALPRGVSRCITAAANKWTFPAADAGCEVDHGLSLNLKSDNLR